MFDQTTIGHTCLIGDGTHSKIARQSSGILYLTCRNFKDGRLDLSKTYYISEQDYAKHFLGGKGALAKPDEGDLLFSIIGTIGQPYLMRDGDCFGISSSVAIVRPNKGLLDPRFLLYWFKSPTFQNALLGVKGGVAQGYVSLEMIRSLPVPILSLALQVRIANILSAYDGLIENCQRRIRILEKMAHALYCEWFVHFRFPGNTSVQLVDSRIGPIPEGWTVTTVANSFEILGGGTPSRKEPNYWEGGTIQWFAPSDLTGAGTMFMDDSGERITACGLAESSARVFPPRSVMLTSRATIGALAINTHEACTNQGFITCLPNERVPLYFLFHWLRESVPTFQRMASGATFKEISRGVFKTIDFVQPPRALVEHFETAVIPMADQILTLQRQIVNLRSTRDLLLPRLLSGQMPLNEIDDADAPVPELRPAALSPIRAETNVLHLGTVASASGERAYSDVRKGTIATLSSRFADRSCEAPPTIDDVDRSEILGVVRQVFSDGEARDREDAIREVARSLGYGRTGSRIQEVLHKDLMTAVRRGILENIRGELRLLARSIEQYDRDFLKDQFLAAIGRNWIERDQAIRTFARWLGFTRTGSVIDEIARSLINGLLREQRIESNGPVLIRRS